MEDMRMNPEQTIQNQFNILTSSDDALVPQIAISLTAMARNLSHAHIDFYLLHSRVSPENIQMLFMKSGSGIRKVMILLCRQGDGSGRPIILSAPISCCRTRWSARCIWTRAIPW